MEHVYCNHKTCPNIILDIILDHFLQNKILEVKKNAHPFSWQLYAFPGLEIIDQFLYDKEVSPYENGKNVDPTLKCQHCPLSLSCFNMSLSRWHPQACSKIHNWTRAEVSTFTNLNSRDKRPIFASTVLCS